LRLAAEGVDTELLTVDEVAPLPGPGVVVGDGLLAEDQALVEAFAVALSRAQQAVIDDPDAGMEAAIEAVPTISEDVDTARAVLLATVELWSSDPETPQGSIDAAVWNAGYATMEDLRFIDGSVPVEEMYWPAIRLE
jgi:ABC-type nitrate/sulfonate/bicarbonate transport system substrate-binding protein